ncbi:MAG: hypothetical protein HUU26_06915 [Gemmatimonadaceae bacterium]|nr:hypothetical protein [Gemmatimonadaceae bacterium]
MNPIHKEYFIEKDRLPVTVALADGEPVDGLLFVQPGWRKPSVELDAPSILRLADPFFPLQLGDGSTRLVAKAQVVVLRGAPADDGVVPDGSGDVCPVQVWCRNGHVVRGRLIITRFGPNTRVLDFLNHDNDEFLIVHEDGATALVNRRHITMVRDDSDGA